MAGTSNAKDTFTNMESYSSTIYCIFYLYIKQA